MNTFQEILMLPGAAPVLADKLSGRIIARIADGFDDDPALGDMMNLYRALEEKWPSNVLSLRDMFDIQLKDASKENESNEAALDELTPEQRAIWMSEPTRTEPRIARLKAALPTIVDLYAAAQPNPDSWEDLTIINQWSLLNATERGLHQRLERYSKWASDDENNGKTDTNAIRLRDDIDEAIPAVFELVSKFFDTPAVGKALQEYAQEGIRVPERVQVA